jgi:repressor LexA
VYRWVHKQLLAGLPPTVREVQLAFGFRSVRSAGQHLEALVDEGRLVREPGKARGFRLPFSRSTAPTVLVPLLGRVPAGPFDLAVQDVVDGFEGHTPVQSRYAADELFGLKVHGDSKCEAGILEGDLVIVRRQPSARSGEIVVARVGDEATVKRLRLHGRRVELHPENSRYRPILPDPRELEILGKVIEVRRRLEP